MRVAHLVNSGFDQKTSVVCIHMVIKIQEAQQSLVRLGDLSNSNLVHPQRHQNHRV